MLLRYSGARAGEAALEIGCGTGAFTVPLAAAVGETGAVVGVDIAAPMLAAAKRRLAEAGLENVSLIEADAQIHGFEPGRFDLVASRFGVMFFADPAAAFTNLKRRPGAWRPAVLCLLGHARRQPALADPRRSRFRPARPARAVAADMPRPDGIPRPRLRALVSRSGRVCRHRDRFRAPGGVRCNAGRGGRVRLSDGPVVAADRRKAAGRGDTPHDPGEIEHAFAAYFRTGETRPCRRPCCW